MDRQKGGRLMAKHDGSITIKAVVDKKQAQKELNTLEKQIDKMEQEIGDMQTERDKANQTSIFKAAELDAEKAKLEQIKTTLQEIKATAKDTSLPTSVRAEATAQLPAAQADLKEQQERVRLLQSEYNKVSDSVDRYDKNLSKAEKKLDRQKTKAGELVKQISSTPKYYEKMAEAQERAEKSAGRWAARMKEVLRSALVFTLISQALAKFREWMGKVIKTNDEATEAIARLQGALLTLAQPIVNVIIPAFISFVNILTAVVSAVANVVSILFGGSISKSKKQAKALNEQMEAIEGVGNAAEKAAGSLASFDEINTLSSINKAGAGGGGISTDGISPDFSALDEFNSAEYKQKIDELTVYISGALLALGAILFFSGANRPLGLALMAAGALGLAAEIKENWNAPNEKIKEAINKVLLTIGASFLAIGAILAFASPSTMALGIGMMAIGAASLVTAAALNWEGISEETKRVINVIMLTLGTAALVIGAILAFSGANLPVGIALMAIGAAALASSIALNWEEIVREIKTTGDDILGYLGTILLVLGAILCFTGVGTTLGVALIAAGAASLASATALNWNTMEQKLKGPIGRTTALVSAASLVIGIILCATGVALPLGVALIAAGAGGLVTVTALNWNSILDRLKNTWNGIKNWWKTSVAKYFTADYWKNLGKDMINGLMNGLDAIYDEISTWASNVWATITSAFSTTTVSAADAVAAQSVPSVTSYTVPKLAAGAVIPPNREFMAVLGDQTSGNNIETPEALLRKIIREESGDSDVLAVLRELLAVTREGRNIIVDKRVLGKVTSEAITAQARASGKAVVTV